MPGYESRLVIPTEYGPWDIPYPGYNPVEFTDPKVLGLGIEQGWADPEDVRRVDFNERSSYLGPLRFNEAGYPLNPLGRMGLAGRGLLGKWGPNQAGDPILFAPTSKAGELALLLIVRGDTKELALPGGMRNPGENLGATARRELAEETGLRPDDVEFHSVYEGYVIDPRNTDNAWMETEAFYAVIPATVEPVADDDADEADWHPVSENLLANMYANHADFVRLALQKVLAR